MDKIQVTEEQLLEIKSQVFVRDVIMTDLAKTHENSHLRLTKLHDRKVAWRKTFNDLFEVIQFLF